MSIYLENVVVNTRCLSGGLTGVQRYTLEMLKQFSGSRTIAPEKGGSGMLGHIWEQIVLPAQKEGGLLWSPATTGPLAVRQQVVTIHDLSFIDHPEWFNKKFADWYGWLVPRLAKRVSHIITDASYTRNRILELTGIDSEKISVIPIGVDARFSPDTSDKSDAVRSLLGIPTAHYILALCSLEPRKNLFRLLDAWRTVFNKLPREVWLVIAGAYGSQSVFKKTVMPTLSERVFLTGFVQDELLPGLIAGATAFAYPSLYEGFGLPPLEAMASGVPVLTGNTTSLPEVVGDAGIMVDPTDIEAIADGLVRLVENEDMRTDLKQKSLSRAKNFNWGITAQRTSEILVAALKGSSHNGAGVV